MSYTNLTVSTTAQAAVGNRLHRSAVSLRRALRAIETDAQRNRDLLNQGMMPSPLSHQLLAEVSQYQGEFQALAEIAWTTGLTPEQTRIIVTEENVHVSSQDED